MVQVFQTSLEAGQLMKIRSQLVGSTLFMLIIANKEERLFLPQPGALHIQGQILPKLFAMKPFSLMFIAPRARKEASIVSATAYGLN